MTPFRRPLHLLAATTVALALVVPNVQAASIFIDAANLEDRVAFNFGQFEGGFSINGSTPITTGGAVFGEGTQLNFTGQWIDLGAAVAFSRTVYWLDPKDESNPPTCSRSNIATCLISEIFQWTITPSGASGLATISGFFQAEGLGTVPLNVNPADVIFEEKNGAHDPFNFSAAFLGGQIITGAALPEPATSWLLGFGVLGIVLGLRRRKITAA